jgi:hypothetical protein
MYPERQQPEDLEEVFRLVWIVKWLAQEKVKTPAKKTAKPRTREPVLYPGKNMANLYVGPEPGSQTLPTGSLTGEWANFARGDAWMG